MATETRFVSSIALSRWTSGSDATRFLSELGKLSKPTSWAHLQRMQMQGDISVDGLSPIPQVIELLEPPQRQFFNVRFSSK